MPPIVSVLIPVYNGLPYFKATIESVLSQEFTDFEVLVADDASTDGTSEYLSSIKDERVKVFTHRKNLGMTPNWDFVLQQANLKYACILGADDIFEPDHLLRKVRLLEANPSASLVHGAFTFIDERGEVIRVEEKSCPEVQERRQAAAALINSAFVDVTTAVYRVESIRRNNLHFEARYTLIPDWPFFLRLALTAGPFLYDSKATVRYRFHSKSISKSAITSFKWHYEYKQVRLDSLSEFSEAWRSIGVDARAKGAEISRDLLPLGLEQIRKRRFANARLAFKSYFDFNHRLRILIDVPAYFFRGVGRRFRRLATILKPGSSGEGLQNGIGC